MRTLVWIAAFFFAVLPCCSQATLREQLQSSGIPLSSFSKGELDGTVDGTGASKQPYVYFVYQRRDRDSLNGFPHLVRYDQSTGEIIRSDLQPKKEDPYCCGSPVEIQFIDDYLLMYFHYNPSASAILVLDTNLKLVQTLDGFDLQKVARNQIVLVENEVHFAPTHPERLQWVDLSKDISLEIYPLKNDALRNHFDREQRKRMPSICDRTPELCAYGGFEEGCTYLGGDGQVRFAFECGRSANFQAQEGKESIPYFTDSAIYLFAHNSKGWVYCAQAISKNESKVLEDEKEHGYEKIKSRCSPKLPVVPDNDR